MNRLMLLTPIIALLGVCQTNPVRGQFQTLIRHLPEGANTLVLFNVEGVLATPLAKTEGWREHLDKMSSSGLIQIPPKSKQFVLGSQMDIELMESRWDSTIMNLSYEPSVTQVTQRYGGSVDQVDGLDAAVLGNDTYVVKFGKHIAGTMSPADRQKATRWVKNAYAGEDRKPLGEYLQEAAGFANKNGTPIIMALDLEHVFSPSFIRDRLDSAELLKGKNIDLDQLAKVLSSIRGVTLGITITDHFFGGLKVDFREDASIMKGFAKPLLLEIVGNHGAMIEEFRDWKIQVNGKQVLLRGPLYKSGMQRVMSVFDTPADLRELKVPQFTEDGKVPESLIAQNTLQYYNMLNQYLDDIVGKKKTTKVQTTGLVAQWYKKYASKIEALPILNTDPEMVDFGFQVAGALRQAQGAMQGVGTNSALRQMNASGSSNVYNYSGGVRAGRYGVRGGYSYRYNPRASINAEGQAKANIRRQEKIKGYGSANQTMQGVTIAMAEMRRKMTEKYQIEF